jgi:hypothetical protein
MAGIFLGGVFLLGNDLTHEKIPALQTADAAVQEARANHDTDALNASKVNREIMQERVTLGRAEVVLAGLGAFACLSGAVYVARLEEL